MLEKQEDLTNKTEFELTEKFLSGLKSHSGSDISEIYRHLFICMRKEDLENTLSILKESVHEENWFYLFHKSIRQTDFYEGVHVSEIKDIRSDQEKNRMEELRKILPFHPFTNAVNSERALLMDLESEMKEFRSLYRKSKAEESRGIGGNLDMCLWNLIHLDKDDFLKRYITNFFNQIQWQ